MNRLTSIYYTVILLFTLSIGLSSCDAIAGIFKAGMWTGVIVIVLIVGLILYFIGRARK